jgi:hypothetical protein
VDRPDPPERSPEGYAVLSGGEVVGYLEQYNPELLAAMHTAEVFARVPESLSRLLEASGAVALASAEGSSPLKRPPIDVEPGRGGRGAVPPPCSPEASAGTSSELHFLVLV